MGIGDDSTGAAGKLPRYPAKGWRRGKEWKKKGRGGNGKGRDIHALPTWGMGNMRPPSGASVSSASEPRGN